MKGWMSMGGAVVVAAAAALSAIPAAAQDAATVARVSVSRSWALPLFQQWSIRPYAAARMAAGDGRAYVATREGRLFAVDAASGGVDWVRDLGGRISGGPAVGEQGRIYAGTDQGKVYALAADNGDTAWEGQVSSEVITAPRVGAGMVFVRTADDFLWALRAADGGSRWSFNVEGRSLALRGGSRPALDDGRVFVGFSSGELVALNAGDGAPRWREAVATPSGRTELERMVDVDAAPRVLKPPATGRVIAVGDAASPSSFPLRARHRPSRRQRRRRGGRDGAFPASGPDALAAHRDNHDTASQNMCAQRRQVFGPTVAGPQPSNDRQIPWARSAVLPCVRVYSLCQCRLPHSASRAHGSLAAHGAASVRGPDTVHQSSWPVNPQIGQPSHIDPISVSPGLPVPRLPLNRPELSGGSTIWEDGANGNEHDQKAVPVGTARARGADGARA